jgi:alpha-L-rhamnosidase
MFRNITSEATASAIIAVQPWSQYANLQGEAPPQSVVRNLSFIGIKGHYNAFGVIRPNPGQTEISDISFKDIDVVLQQDKLAASGVTGLKFENVIVNGQPQSA